MLYAWPVYLIAACVMTFVVGTYWIASAASTGQASSSVPFYVVWRVFALLACVLVCLCIATYRVRWVLSRDGVTVGRSVLGVVFSRVRDSRPRLVQYRTAVRHSQGLHGRGAHVIVLETSRRWIVLLVSRSGDEESYKGWDINRYSKQLGLPYEADSLFVVRSAW